MPLFLSNEDQERCITPAEAIDAYAAGLEQMYRGDALRRPRVDNLIPTDDPSLWFEFSSMEGGQRDGYYALRIKPNMMRLPIVEGKRRIVTYNSRPGLYGGLVFLFDSRTAEFVAILNDGVVQHQRVAASTALGIRWMARDDVRTLGIYGSSAMARFVALFAQEVRPFERLIVYSPNKENVAAFVESMRGTLRMDIEPVEDPRWVASQADVVAACTNSFDPVVKGEWIQAGTHLNNVLPGEFGVDTYERINAVGIFVPRTPMSIAGLVDDDFGHRIQVMSWIAGTPDERDRIPDGFPPSSREPNRCPNARITLCYDWSTGRAHEREDAEEITYLASYSHGTLEGDAGASAGLQGLQFSAVGGAIYENAKRMGVGVELPTEMFQQDIPT